MLMISRSIVSSRFLFTESKPSILQSLAQMQKSFPYRIHRNKYLIPQKPQRSTKPTLKSQDSIQQETSQHNIQEYKNKMLQYNEKYLKPSNINSISGASIFTKEFFESKKGKGLKESSAAWKALNQQQKQQYISKAETIKKSQMGSFIQYCKNYEIPKVKNYKPTNFFVQENINKIGNGKLTKELFQAYQKKSQQEKQQYQKKAATKSLQTKQHFQEFLKNKNLTQEKFKAIINLSKQLKQEKKNKNKKQQTGKLSQKEQI